MDGPSNMIGFEQIEVVQQPDKLDNMYFKGIRSTQSPSGGTVRTPCTLQYVEYITGCDVKSVELACKRLMKLKHENIVRVHGFTVDTKGKAYLVLDDEGDPFLSVVKAIKDLRCDSETNALLFAIDVALQVVSALRYLEKQKIPHMDLRLAHLVVRPNGRVALRGFYNPVYVHVEEKKSPKEFFALHCDVPELLTGGGTVDCTVDHYLLGWMLCELITGELPHPRGTPKGLEDTRQRVMVGADLVIDDLSWPSCAPQVLKDAIRRLLSFDSSRRGSLGRLAKKLDKIRAELQLLANSSPADATTAQMKPTAVRRNHSGSIARAVAAGHPQAAMILGRDLLAH